MQVHYDDKTFLANLAVIKKSVRFPSFMIKKEFLHQIWVSHLQKEKMYSNIDGVYWDNIYDDPKYTIVDAFDQREGITMEQAKLVQYKHTAVVNFYCCNNKIPTLLDLQTIYDNLTHVGYENVSFGGSMIMFYDFHQAETRIGEVLYTGYCDAFEQMYPGCESPYKMYVPVAKETDTTYVVNYGLRYFSGFSNVTPLCVNTDVSVFRKADITAENGMLMLHPDYYTLIKLAHNDKI